jgi:hypothetical protein
MEYAGQCSISEKPGGRGGCSSFAASSQILKDRSKKFMDIPIFWKKYQTDIPVVLVKNQNLDDALRILKKDGYS